MPNYLSIPTARLDDQPRSCSCHVFVRHDMREAGESRVAPWCALFITRILSALVCLKLILLQRLRYPLHEADEPLSGAFDEPKREHLYYIIYSFCALTYFALAAATWLKGKGARLSQSTTLATIIVHLHSICASLSIYCVIEFVRKIRLYFVEPSSLSQILALLVPSVVYLFDVLVMQSRIRLGFRRTIFFTLVAVIYTIVYLVSAGYCFDLRCLLLPRLSDYWRRAVLINVVFGFAASIIAVSVTKLSPPFGNKQ